MGRSEHPAARGCLRTLSVAVMLAIAGQAFAQSSEDGKKEKEASKEAKTLDTVQVVGSAVNKQPTLTRDGASIRETPQTITVLDQERIEQQNMRTLDDVLAQVPGVVTIPSTLGTYSPATVRGLNMTSTLYEGMPTSASVYLTTQPNMAGVEQVEVLRGANGVLNGVNGFGATNIISKKPLDNLAISGLASFGSWDSKAFQIDVSSPLTRSGRLRGRLVAAYEDKDSFIDIVTKETKYLYGVVQYDVTDNTLLTVSAAKQDIDMVPYIMGAPRYGNGGNLELPRSTYLGAAWNNKFTKDVQYRAMLETRFENGWRSRFMAQYIPETYFHERYAYPYGAIDPETLTGSTLYASESTYKNKQYSFDYSVDGEIEIFGRKHWLLFGANFQDQENAYVGGDYGDSGVLATDVDIFHWDPYSIPYPGQSARQTAYGTLKPYITKQSGVFASGRFALTDDLFLRLAMRMSWWEYSGAWYDADVVTGEIIDSGSSGYKVSQEITPQAGLVWNLGSHTSLYASYSDIFTPQSSQTYTGALVDPIVGANYEAGIKSELFGNRLLASFAVFRVEQENMAQVDYEHSIVEGGAISQYYYEGSGQTVSDGFEIEAIGHFANGVTLGGGYTYNETKYKKNLTQQGRPYRTDVPKNLFKLWVNYKVPALDNKLSIGGSMVAMSDLQRPISTSNWDTGGNFSQGGYAIYSLSMAYEISPVLQLQLNANNIFDKKYYGAINSIYAGNYYGDPRNVALSLRFKFD